MKRDEMIRSFANAPGVCKQQCPYQSQCHHGDYCVFKEVALLLSADAEKIDNLKTQVRMLRDLCGMIINYGKYMEKSCFDYYDAIYAYNGGVEKKLWIPRKRELAARRRRKTMKAKKMLRDRELMDGDPRYADPNAHHAEPIPETIV